MHIQILCTRHVIVPMKLSALEHELYFHVFNSYIPLHNLRLLVKLSISCVFYFAHGASICACAYYWFVSKKGRIPFSPLASSRQEPLQNRDTSERRSHGRSSRLQRQELGRTRGRNHVRRVPRPLPGGQAASLHALLL